MFLKGLLQLGVRIAALPRHVSLRVVEFVLVERELRFGEFDFVIVGQFGDAGGLLRDARLERRDMIGQLFERSFDWSGRSLGVAERHGEALVDFVIGKAQSVTRVILLSGRVGK